jgi:hypothetical protein
MLHVYVLDPGTLAGVRALELARAGATIFGVSDEGGASLLDSAQACNPLVAWQGLYATSRLVDTAPNLFVDLVQILDQREATYRLVRFDWGEGKLSITLGHPEAGGAVHSLEWEEAEGLSEAGAEAALIASMPEAMAEHPAQKLWSSLWEPLGLP